MCIGFLVSRYRNGVRYLDFLLYAHKFKNDVG